MIKLSDYVIKFVADRGVKHIFMLSGGGCMHLVDSVGSCPAIRYICNLHEQAAAIAAEAYGQYTNNLGVALVTTGPGGTNALTGVAGAWLDSTPCLFLSGQVKRADMKGDRAVRQMGFQEIEIARMVEPITKYVAVVTDPLTIRFHLEKAVHLAKTGRPGPVWIDIPLDVQAAMIDEAALEGYTPSACGNGAETIRLKETVGKALELLTRAERPVILVGGGVRLAGAVDDFLVLAEKLQVPVLTTWKSLDFLPESHPLYAGRPGAIGQRGANFTQQNSDCLLILGARLDLGQTAYSHENFARAARKIMVDIDPGEIAKMKTRIDVPVVADAGEFIREMVSQVGPGGNPRHADWLRQAKAWQAQYPLVTPEQWAEKDGVSTYVLIDVLSSLMKGGDLLIPGSSGTCSEVTMQAFRVGGGVRVFNTEGLGSMGFGIPAALGGCVASGGRRTVCIDGDGGWFMNIQDLETVSRLNLPIKFFVLNNAGYASIRNMQKGHFAGRLVACDASCGVTLPDIQKVAQSYGVASCRIENHAMIREQVAEILAQPGPAVCEVMVAASQQTVPRVISMQKPNGMMVSMPMENMFPFLPREEFLRNMLVEPLPE